MGQQLTERKEGDVTTFEHYGPAIIAGLIAIAVPTLIGIGTWLITGEKVAGIGAGVGTLLAEGTLLVLHLRPYISRRVPLYTLDQYFQDYPN